MRIRALSAAVVLASVAASARASGNVRVSARGAVPVSPLVQLGGLIEASAPGLAPDSLMAPLSGVFAAELQSPLAAQSAAAGPEALPSVWRPERAAELAEAARKEDLRGVRSAARSSSGPGAAALLEKTNAVLQGIPAAKLGEMSGEELRGVAALVLRQLGVLRAPEEVLSGLVAVSRAELAALRATPYRYHSLNPQRGIDKQEEVVIDGLPPVGDIDLNVDRTEVEPRDTVFRHYTTTEGLAEIKKSRSLMNGFLPYVQLARGVYRRSFNSVNGLFLTLPSFGGSEVGVPERDYPAHVDVRIPGLPLVRLEPGIFVVPFPSRTRDWVRDIYFKWLRGEPLSSDYERMARAMDAHGGPGPDIAVPVEIIRSSKGR